MLELAEARSQAAPAMEAMESRVTTLLRCFFIFVLRM
jgi:hypothetical protein